MANLFNLHEFPVIISEKSPVSPSSSFSKEAQRKGAKEIHKYFMAKRILNESRKSKIHKVLALTAHSKNSEHSSSSSEHKSSNGSKMLGQSTPDLFVYSNFDSDEDEGVLRPAPEQQLRILLPKGTVPFKDTYTSNRSWPSLHNPKRNTTPWNPGLPSHEG
ncbi:hypothetical protein Taro_003665 [Colocasia esculenta]|uniref:Uncharacterized protein n=1 Tax=Colocasia esculenta TaxID=4460 RepID=A0A843TG28_COLES|nr:hypothetical protein [Colocasia esculenta]